MGRNLFFDCYTFKLNISRAEHQMAQNIKTTEELRQGAWVYLPQELVEVVKQKSIFPKLINSLESFLSILKVSDKSPESWKEILNNTSTLSANLFLEHLCILANVGGEPLDRIAKNISEIFPNNRFEFTWKGQTKTYLYKCRNLKWTNSQLGLREDKLAEPIALTDNMEDAIMTILWAGTKNPEQLPDVLQRCNIGNLLGNSNRIDEFVKHRYIHISPILRGRDANTTGYVCEESVHARLKNRLPKKGFSIQNKGIIPGVRDNNKDTKFDLVVKREIDNKFFGIEIMFQTTTNSVIERKANEAENRRSMCHRQGHFIVNIVDGAGCFERDSALKKIIRYSDCCVNMSDSGIADLVEFIEGATDDILY